MMKNAFYSMLKTFSFLRFLKFCPDFFLHVGKWLDKKDQFNFKIFDLIYWETNDYKFNSHELKTIR